MATATAGPSRSLPFPGPPRRPRPMEHPPRPRPSRLPRPKNRDEETGTAPIFHRKMGAVRGCPYIYLPGHPPVGTGVHLREAAGELLAGLEAGDDDVDGDPLGVLAGHVLQRQLREDLGIIARAIGPTVGDVD